ncbi:MAG: M20/M25/M40 family metallo-hydrolase [Pseudomonadales bacterium]|nr:M20/M25/M40 family metallo-hydrolase [Pseudomonadales bacterium]
MNVQPFKALLASFIIAAVMPKAFSQPAVVEHLSQAITYQTISHQDKSQIDPQAFTGFVQFLHATYPQTFSKLDVTSISKHSLIIHWPGSNNRLKPVMFDAHYDVVPVEKGTEGDWLYPAFSGAIAEKQIWGRGALDDKASVIALLEATELLLTQGFKPQRGIYISLVHDEEIGGEQGAKIVGQYLLEKGIQMEYLIAEGGTLVTDHPLLPSNPVAMIGLAEKTYLTLTLSVEAKGGHSSMPAKENAIVMLAEAVSILHNNPFPSRLRPPVDDMFAVLGDHVDGIQGFLFSNQWLTRGVLAYGLSKDPVMAAMVRDTTAVTMFNAGVKENVVPQKAEAKVNFRLLPETDVDNFIVQVNKLVDNTAVSISAQQWSHSSGIADIDGKGYAALTQAIEKHVPDVIVTPSLVMATTDSRHYSKLTDNIYRFHPYSVSINDTSIIHGSNERISIAAIIQAVDVTKTLLQQASQP